MTIRARPTREYRVPTLVMHGEDDQIVWVKDFAEKSARLIKAAKEVHERGRRQGSVKRVGTPSHATKREANPKACELEFALEEEFGIEIPRADALKITTVGEAVSYIAAVG